MSDPQPERLRVLVLGGYGGFGGRVSVRLADAGHEILVAGRDKARAHKFCAGRARLTPLALDRAADLAPVLAKHRPDVLVDASGPFQGQDFSVPKACITAGIAYLDIADARDFVTGIAALDAEACAAGVAIVSGASSVPALSGAVVRNLAEGMDAVHAIEIAISASNRATAGPSVAAAILGYVGRPVRLWRGGRWTIGHGWQDMRRESFVMAGAPPLGRRWIALADVPDLALLPGRIAGTPAVTFRAGSELAIQNCTLWLASRLVRAGWIASLAPLARWLLPLQRVTAGLGSDRSAMIVRLLGLSDGRRIERRWTLIASNGAGPEIPALTVPLLVERIAAGGLSAGARDAGEALSLADYQPAFAALAIRHERREIPLPPPLYARVMGAAFDRLPEAVRAMHAVVRDGGACGEAIVARGRNPLASAVAAIVGFPAAGEHPLHVHFAERNGTETWTRNFSGRAFRSRLSERQGKLVERFGPLSFTFDLIGEENGLVMAITGWRIGSLPLPLWLAPRSRAREWVEEGRFHFDVPIALPLIGLIVHYRGWLTATPGPEG